MKCYLQKKKMKVRKFTRDDILDACYEGESADGNLILIHEGDMELDDDLIAFENQRASKKFILKTKDDKKFYSHTIYWHIEKVEEDREIELIEVKEKQETVTVWEAIED